MFLGGKSLVTCILSSTLREGYNILKLATLGENAPIVGAALLLEVPEETIIH
jgi:hypothetical protein